MFGAVLTTSRAHWPLAPMFTLADTGRIDAAVQRAKRPSIRSAFLRWPVVAWSALPFWPGSARFSSLLVSARWRCFWRDSSSVRVSSGRRC